MIKRCALPLAFVVILLRASSLLAGDGGTVVLDTTGYWRVYQVMKPPVVDAGGGLQKVEAVMGQRWLNQETPEPPKEWTQPGFDDSTWIRGTSRISSDTEYLARLCLRGKFLVTNPGQVTGLSLDMGYFGGAIVYVNGKELKRGNLDGKGQAAVYGAGAYSFGRASWEDLILASSKAKTLMATRLRKFEKVPVPGNLLRKGVNVLALEIIRPPADKIVLKKAYRKHPSGYQFNWAPCALRHVQLIAAGPGGVVQNAVRPKGMQIWNSSLMTSDFGIDFGDTAEELRPVRIVGTRNGSFSGKVMVGSDSALKGFKVTMSDLKCGGATIPASAVRVRYGIPWGTDGDNITGGYGRYRVEPLFLGALAEPPMAEIPVRSSAYKTTPGYGVRTPNPVKPVSGAVTSVWLTVDVPKDAQAGDYKGTVTVTAQGQRPLKAAVELSVADWEMPDTDDFNTLIEIIQSPNTLVEEYKVERWSDKHFEMIAESMKHIGNSGSRILYIPVICHTNIGNEESMVRWVKKGDYKYEWDFTLVNKYLDTAEKHMGRPKVVCFWLWEKFMFPTAGDPTTYEQYSPGQRVARKNDIPGGGGALAAYVGKGPKVTLLDRATGKLDKQHIPYLLDPKSKPLWRSLIVELEKLMTKRGLRDTMLLGTPSDIVMRKEHFDFFNEIAPGHKWVNHSHFNVSKLYEAHGAKLGYFSTVINVWHPGYPEDGRKYGWQRKERHAHMRSRWGKDYFPLSTWRHIGEVNITGDQRGVGRLGGDMWSVVKDKRGRRQGRIFRKYLEAGWRSNDICSSLLAPGPKGPIATVRYEVTREGFQECEARIFIERALTDPRLKAKLGGKLAARCQEVLDERLKCLIRGMSSYKLDGYIPGMAGNRYFHWWNTYGTGGNIWFMGSGWQKRTADLYAAAADVARALGLGTRSRKPTSSGRTPAARPTVTRKPPRIIPKPVSDEQKAKRLWKSGENYDRNNMAALAKRRYKEILSKYPDSKYATMAKEKLSGMGE